jgi:Uma2 family endonuclease
LKGTLNGENVVVYRDPGPEGYRDVSTARGAGSLSPLAFPDLIASLGQILG